MTESKQARPYPSEFPPQGQGMPGSEHKMEPSPAYSAPWYKGSGKLMNKVALITGGDSGIGRAVAILYAREGCDICIVYYHEHRDAEETKEMVQKEGRKCICIVGDIGKKDFCNDAAERCVKELGKLDILVNNAAVQFESLSIEEITEENLDRTFRTNIYGMFFMTQACIKHLKEGSSIINTTSVTAYKGSHHLLDYSATKGAIVTFTYSLSQNLVSKQIRVNGVAPGPIWTPLIPATFDEEHVKKFGQNVPMKRAGQPEEVAPSYVFLASHDSSYITGQILHPNGGTVVHG